jgi:anti-sigma factor ChrR (cupin superfamily)
MTETINGNLALSVCVDTHLAEWAPSPSGTVWRKRVHLVGPPESGQVTSVVRYEPGATFPEHDHPDGEEILVLEGVFSDEHGNWPKGSYLLNPDGFRHAPYSQSGCVIFVKLRQFPGEDRDHVAISTNQLAWTEGDRPGVEIKELYAQPGYTDRTRIERWAKNTSVSSTYRDGAELFVIDGDFADESGMHRAFTWMRMPKNSTHATRTNDGCTLYIKEGGFTYLNSTANGG